jgi:hypothetical protein
VTRHLRVVVGAFAVAGALAVGLAVAVTYKHGSLGASEASRALYAMGGTHDLCMDSDIGTTFTEGLDGFANRGPGPVHIDRVELLNNHGLKLLAIAVVQRQEGELAGFGALRGVTVSPWWAGASRETASASAWSARSSTTRRTWSGGRSGRSNAAAAPHTFDLVNVERGSEASVRTCSGVGNVLACTFSSRL